MHRTDISALTLNLKKKNKLLNDIRKNYVLYLLCLPAVVLILIFQYGPMYGVQIAFKEFIAVEGITGSPWIGFENFERFFRSFKFWQLVWNTAAISIYEIVVAFPLPIFLALMLNEVRNRIFKKSVQMITYAPHFISTVVMVGMLYTLLDPTTGILNRLLNLFGIESVRFMSNPGWFRTVYVFSGVWQGVGWGSILYIAALSGIDPQLHEAAQIDGASKIKRILNVDLPGIMPVIVIQLILQLGRVMTVGFEKVFLMQNSLNISTADVISTYVYHVGLLGSDFGFASAVGLFNSLINLILLISVNYIAGKVSETSLW